MPRSLDPSMQAALAAGVVCPAILAQITFATSTEYIWTGIGPLLYDAQTYTGVGSLASLGTVTEGTTVKADGTTVGLSGIDASLYADCMTEIQTGAPAKIWFALLTQGVVIGAPYLLFSGLVDQPTIEEDTDAITINLALESRLTNLQRASQRRYTSADQRNYYPDDIGFGWVELLNDTADVWA